MQNLKTSTAESTAVMRWQGIASYHTKPACSSPTTHWQVDQQRASTTWYTQISPCAFCCRLVHLPSRLCSSIPSTPHMSAFFFFYTHLFCSFVPVFLEEFLFGYIVVAPDLPTSALSPRAIYSVVIWVSQGGGRGGQRNNIRKYGYDMIVIFTVTVSEWSHGLNRLHSIRGLDEQIFFDSYTNLSRSVRPLTLQWISEYLFHLYGQQFLVKVYPRLTGII